MSKHREKFWLVYAAFRLNFGFCRCVARYNDAYRFTFSAVKQNASGGFLEPPLALLFFHILSKLFEMIR